MTIHITNNYDTGSTPENTDWRKAIEAADGSLKARPFFLRPSSPASYGIGLSLPDLDQLIRDLPIVRRRLLAAQTQARAVMLPTEPGYYVHQRWITDGLEESASILKLDEGGTWSEFAFGRSSIGAGPSSLEDILETVRLWGGTLAKIEVTAL